MMRAVTALFAFAILSAVDGFRTRRSGRHSQSSCGIKGGSNVSTSIVNGDEAEECAWKWQVALRKRSWNKRVFCGGMLLSPEWVLTAAHCATKADFDVVVGEHDSGKKSDKEQWRRAAKFIRHFRYNANMFDYDYAMVKLDRPVEMNDCAGTVCLPTADVSPGRSCWITGWGSEKVGGSLNKMLQQAEVKTISTADCGHNFGYDSCKITSNMMCAQGQTAGGSIIDACAGDSGGPLVCDDGGRWTLYGVTSWGSGCAKPDHPGVWSNVHEAMDWIQDILSGQEPTLPPGSCPPYCRRCPLSTGCTSSACAGCCD
jgi:secreted trypsin-like serine protease